MKDAFDGLIRRQETTEPQASELEEMTRGAPKAEQQREHGQETGTKHCRTTTEAVTDRTAVPGEE